MNRDLRLYYLSGGILKKFGRGKTDPLRHLFNSEDEVREYLGDISEKLRSRYRRYQLLVMDYSYPEPKLKCVIRPLENHIHYLQVDV